MRVELPIAIAILMMVPGAAWAHDHARGSKHGQEARTGAATDFGRPGVSTKATRTVAIGMDDRMRFYPANLEVKKGETIRFVVRNSGKLYHEMAHASCAARRSR